LNWYEVEQNAFLFTFSLTSQFLSLSLTPIVLLCCTVLSFLLLSKCVPRAVQSCVELETKNPNFRCWSFALPCMPSFVRLNATSSRSCKSKSLRKLEMWQQQQRHHPSVVSTVTDKMCFNFLFLSSQTYFPLVLSLSLCARAAINVVTLLFSTLLLSKGKQF
jgi:hypothetical protein